MERRIQQALGELKIPVPQRIPPPANSVHRTSTSIVETFDVHKAAEDLTKVHFT